MANTHSLDLESTNSQFAESAAFQSTITGNFTIEFWLKPESLATSMCIISHWKASTNARAYMIEIDASGNVIPHTSGNGATDSNASFAAGLTTGTWQHIACVFTTATHKMEVFKNGVSISSNTASYGSGVDNGTCELAIGTISNIHGDYYDGLIDEVRIWNTVKTGADILAAYQMELVGNESGLVHYYQLNNGYTATTGGQTLTASGSPVFSTDIPAWVVPGVFTQLRRPFGQAINRASTY